MSTRVSELTRAGPHISPLLIGNTGVLNGLAAPRHSTAAAPIVPAGVVIVLDLQESDATVFHVKPLIQGMTLIIILALCVLTAG